MFMEMNTVYNKSYFLNKMEMPKSDIVSGLNVNGYFGVTNKNAYKIVSL